MVNKTWSSYKMRTSSLTVKVAVLSETSTGITTRKNTSLYLHNLNSRKQCLFVINKLVRTKHGPGVHGPPLWTGSMDPLSWTRSMDSFFYFYKKVLHQVHGQKTEIVPKKDFTRRCRPMLTIDQKYLVVLTWRTLCLHKCMQSQDC